MFGRIRFVRVLKRAGTLVCLLILAAFVTMVWHQAWWNPSPGLTINVEVQDL